MADGLQPLFGGHDIRGLEAHTTVSSTGESVDSKLARLAVLDGQKRQEDLFLDDPQSIANVYAQHSAEPVRSAVERVMQDEKQAEHFGIDDKECRTWVSLYHRG